jgi:hypothetical protein
MKRKLALAALALTFATPASAQSALYNIIDGNQVCVQVGSPPTMMCSPLSPQARANIARAKAERGCKAYGFYGQRRRR